MVVDGQGEDYPLPCLLRVTMRHIEDIADRVAKSVVARNTTPEVKRIRQSLGPVRDAIRELFEVMEVDDPHFAQTAWNKLTRAVRDVEILAMKY
jgi:hypothetical protein